MKKKSSSMAVLGLIVVLAGTLVPLRAQDTNWIVKQEKDEMTDKVITMVMTGAEGASKDDPFAALGIGCYSGKKAEFAITTKGIEYLPKQTGLLQGLWGRWLGYPTTEVRYRFDSGKESGKEVWVLTQANALYIDVGRIFFVKKIENAALLRVQYQNANGEYKVLTFDVHGLREVIKRLPECKVD